jgi:hypothetical protein
VSRCSVNKPHIIILTITGVLAGWIFLHTPYKITDPNDHRFDPMQFKFSDYNVSQNYNVISKLFASGDARGYVEKILIESAGAFPSKTNDRITTYSWLYPWHDTDVWLSPNKHGWVTILYDENDRLLAMQMNGVSVFNGAAIIQAEKKNSTR